MVLVVIFSVMCYVGKTSINDLTNILLHCYTLLLVHNPISEQPHVSEVARDILHEFQIIVTAVFPIVIVGFNGNAVLMLKDCIKQSPVGVSAGVSHDQHLKRCRH